MFGRDKSPMSENQRLRWEKTRKRGEGTYCLLSALLVGAIAFIVRGYSDLFVHHLSMTQLFFDSIKPVVIGAGGGLFSGFWEWHSNEDRYIRAMQQNPPNEINLNGSDYLRGGKLNGNNI
jgi:hypothetical protein